ncbi:proton-conducting transporter transmembrane domain-containing protein [Cupriavidus basilensis]
MLFWLPKAYASATGSAAALFAIMTKVGIYAILRCAALIFGAPDGMLAAFLHDWVWWMALATMGFGALGALAAPNLKTLTCYLVLASVGLLAAGGIDADRTKLGGGAVLPAQYHVVHGGAVPAGGCA